jgi:hypothetical protein
MRRHLLPVALVSTLVGAVVLAGCSSDTASSNGRPSRSARATASSSPSSPAPASSSPTGPASSPTPSSTVTASRPPKLPTSRLEAASYHEAVLGRNAASGPEQQAVVDAWMRFWQSAADSFFNGRPAADLDQVATGPAHDYVLGYLRDQERKHVRAVGWSRDNVLAVSVHGDKATVHDCTKNFTFSLDEDGEPASRPDPWYRVTGQLRRQQGSWLVVDQQTTKPKTSCLP